MRRLLLITLISILAGCGGARSGGSPVLHQAQSGPLRLSAELDPTAPPTLTRFLITVRTADGRPVERARVFASSRQQYPMGKPENVVARPYGSGTYGLDLHLQSGSGWEVHVGPAVNRSSGDLTISEDLN